MRPPACSFHAPSLGPRRGTGLRSPDRATESRRWIHRVLIPDPSRSRDTAYHAWSRHWLDPFPVSASHEKEALAPGRTNLPHLWSSVYPRFYSENRPGHTALAREISLSAGFPAQETTCEVRGDLRGNSRGRLHYLCSRSVARSVKCRRPGNQ